MKRISTLSALMVFGVMSATAQTYPLFSTSENIDIGNIKAAHLVHGDMWWDPASGTPRCEFPKGGGKHVGYATDLWMGGNDAQKILKFSAQIDRQNGTDYWPGPYDTTATTAAANYANSRKWAKIWKLDWRQIDTFRKLSTHTTANTPLPILEWPANGNPYAKGGGGASLTITRAMAPFVDMNNDGRYNPLNGDYPAMKGDQMLWWVINDYGPTAKTVSGSVSIGLEVQISAYAYARNTAVDNVIFYEYLVQNGKVGLQNFRIGQYSGMDLGYPFDDYCGFDSSHRMAITYNGKHQDGVGGPGDYGENPPAAGITILEMPGDAWNAYQPAGSFMLVSSKPQNGLEMYRYMNSMDFNGLPLSNNRRYLFDIDSPSFYNECLINTLPGDRRFVLASGDLILNPGDTKKFAVALVVASGTGGCPNFNPTNLLRTGDTAYKYYWNPPPMQTTSVGTRTLGQLRIYPNPAKNMLYVETGNSAKGSITIYNAIGQQCSALMEQKANRIQIALDQLSAGVYTIRYSGEDRLSNGIFVKE